MVKKLEVLVVEDQMGDALLVLEMLNAAGVPSNLTVVKDGRAALDILEEANDLDDRPMPEVVILDLNLPRVQGFEVLRRMRESPSSKNIPVVIMTGAVNDEDEARARELDVAVYCKKPIGLQEMDEVIGRLERSLAPLVRRGKRSAATMPPLSAPTSSTR